MANMSEKTNPPITIARWCDENSSDKSQIVIGVTITVVNHVNQIIERDTVLIDKSMLRI
jgi:hypothetical protein